MDKFGRHKLLIIYSVLLLVLYTGSYLHLRRVEVHTSQHMFVSFDPGSYVAMPVTPKAIRDMRNAYRELGGHANLSRINTWLPEYMNDFYNYSGFFENAMPLRYRFYLPAIHAEMIFWMIYLTLT